METSGEARRYRLVRWDEDTGEEIQTDLVFGSLDDATREAVARGQFGPDVPLFVRRLSSGTLASPTCDYGIREEVA